MTGTPLNLMVSTHTKGFWKKKHPDTMVLSDRTGYRRDYDRDPYSGYEKSDQLMFGVKIQNRKFHPKEWLIGLKLGDKAKAYPFLELEMAELPLKDELTSVPVSINYDRNSKTAVILDKNGKELPSVVGFWFAWYAFHPETDVFVNEW